VYSTCLHCTKDLGSNDVIETLPVGRRLAFDASKGRLWVVCRHCAKWNLVPFDTRLESIDACERLFRDTRTRFSTDNIGLAKVGDGLELVRVGVALRPEFAAWRYGAQYRRRRRRNIAIGTVVGIGAGAVVAVGVAAVVAFAAATGVVAWGGDASARRLAGWMRRRQSRVWLRPMGGQIPFQVDNEHAALSTLDWDRGEIRLMLGRPGQLGAEEWLGSDLLSNGRILLGSLNGTAGTVREVGDAAYLVGRHGGDLDKWLRGVAGGRGTGAGGGRRTLEAHYAWKQLSGAYVVLRNLSPVERLAVEMWMNEDIERTWLEGELKLLEREWRDAERLAKIADDLLMDADVSPLYLSEGGSEDGRSS